MGTKLKPLLFAPPCVSSLFYGNARCTHAVSSTFLQHRSSRVCDSLRPQPSRFQPSKNELRTPIKAAIYRLRPSTLSELLPVFPLRHQLASETRTTSERIDSWAVCVVIILLTIVLPILPSPAAHVVRIVAVLAAVFARYRRVLVRNARFRLSVRARAPRVVLGKVWHDDGHEDVPTLSDGQVVIRTAAHQSDEDEVLVSRDGAQDGCALVVGTTTLALVSLDSDVVRAASPFVNVAALKRIGGSI